MSLRDEVPNRDNGSIASSYINHQAHNDIDRQINEFIAMGGAIKSYPYGATANKEAIPLIFNESNPGTGNDYKARIEKGKIGAKRNKAEKPMFAFPERSKYAKRSEHGMNIRKNGSGFCVTIGGAVIDFAIPTLEQAIAVRDKARESLGMSKAPY